ncbi:putative vacuolar amino acid transporter YPQ1 [Pseudocercospora fuligena]|uniref:Putative vacuolar amino acid transporter YPQ1 n=1 Tax=Pseudocercospora fuligena TaxID=685502 RepID=A0A8H6VKZ6_9PEZI|nr:putative vacuolar amino acid transporter YPQ1 [Pseudocercospora fuligena]
MFPPSGSYSVDIEAISGICGSISIACWVVVFSPQIIENFRKSSAEGLSVEFIIIWLAGDVFNILGAVLQGVLATMIVLAVYYTLADIVLLGQYFYYQGFHLRDPKPVKPTGSESDVPTERSPLLSNGHANGHAEPNQRGPNAADVEIRNGSPSTFRERLMSLDAAHMSPAVPIHPQPRDVADTEALKPHQPRSWTQAILFNSTAILLVVLAGIAGYYLTPSTPENKRPKYPAEEQEDSLQFSLWGQIFGYICAVLYLGSRVPQLLLNYRRKSTDGLNALFFLFACIGNLTYVCSIFAFEPICSHHRHGHWQESSCKPGEAPAIYGRYILVNLSWLIGSLGTLFLDFAVFIQFWIYRNNSTTQGNLATTSEDEDRGRESNGR